MITRYSDHATVVETDEDILAFEVTGGALERAAVVPEVQVQQSEFAPLNNRRDWSS
jgi:hypothetical protein